MITLERFREIEAAVREAGYSDAIERSETPTAPATAYEFAAGAIYVIANSGMRNSVARPIYERCMIALKATDSCKSVFGHPGKSAGIDLIWAERDRLFAEYLAAEDKVAFLQTLSWIGPITKLHLAKNFGGDFAKPDVHLNRLADAEGTTAQALCERLGTEAGYRAATIDLILWRACADGIISSFAADHR
ncbi:hypothetical protein [Sphingomonas sp. PB4P5]|uniref:hypothetical protein n=1 Tax=Parasphingomonas puruogangriensis TaxID=3096155 RepID=UPI002FCBB21D